MRRLNRYCFKRCQPKLSWEPENIYNMRRFRPFEDARLDWYAIQWKAKTLCRLYFNGDVTHRWFRLFFNKNHRNIWETLSNNERRLDMAIFRALFAPSIFQASSIISTGRVAVNGITCRQPSYLLKDGDLVSLDGKGMARNEENVKQHFPWIKFWAYVPRYLEVSWRTGSFVFLRTPEYRHIPHPFPRQMILALGSFYQRA